MMTPTVALRTSFALDQLATCVLSSMRAYRPLLLSTFLVLTATSVFAGSATWTDNPTSNDWHTASNWTPVTVPNGPSDTATFGTSNTTSVSISTSNVEVNEITFEPGASAFTTTLADGWYLTISGVGITNNSGITQNFAFTPSNSQNNVMQFTNSANAGIFTNYVMSTGGVIDFLDNSSAGHGSFTFDDYSQIEFDGTSTAGNGTFTLNGGELFGSAIYFNDSATAGSGTFTLNGNGAYCGCIFYTSGTSAGSSLFTINGAGPNSNGASFVALNSGAAESATFIANPGVSGGYGGGKIFLTGDSTGGTSTIKVFGDGNGDRTDGTLDISGHISPGVTIGSLEGGGLVLLGTNNLTIGINNLSTTFSGVIDGYAGSITKSGTGTLILSGVNTFIGPTAINAGKMSVTGSIVSDVTINNGGTLGGGGTVGSVTVNSGGVVAPGDPKTLTVNGDYEQSSASTLALAITGAAPDQFNQMIVGGTITLTAGSILELDFTGGFAPHTGDEFDLLTFDSLTGSFTTVKIVGLAEGFQYTIAPDQSGHLQLTALNDGVATTSAAKLLNISTRADVQTDDRVLIGGLIISGSAPKNLLLRAIGPSLGVAGIAGALADPILELHSPDNMVITNDNWRDTQEEAILLTGLAPTDELESAIVATLEPGLYTAIVRGSNSGTGVALVEAYDVEQTADSGFANISTRGFVQTGDNVMIGGFIVGGGENESSSVIIRGLGPSLEDAGVTDALQDPTVDLYDADGSVVASNDDWKDSQQAEIEAADLAPTNDREAALAADLLPGSYTAIERGKDNTSGVGLVEIYKL
jgi:autotransporter-associated beta strand protein